MCGINSFFIFKFYINRPNNSIFRPNIFEFFENFLFQKHIERPLIKKKINRKSKD